MKPAWPSIVGALRGMPNAGLNWRQVVLSAAVGLWATRCMSTPSLSLADFFCNTIYKAIGQ